MSLPSLYATEGPYLRLVRARACRYVATRIPTDECGAAPSLCVVRRYLQLENNQLVALPALVFNGLTNLR